MAQKIPGGVDGYIATFAPEIQVILEKIRQTVKAAAPDAEETISYRMPAFRLNGMLIYFAAFKGHVGLFPPVRGNESLMRAVKPWRRASQRVGLVESVRPPATCRLAAQ
jgi:uncharacterized protein YdhG (YjbR/CyaY superfamily)